MEKIRNWLKVKLRKFLDVEELASKFNNHVDSNYVSFSNLYNTISVINRNLTKDISHLQESINILHRTIENVVHIGTDVTRNNDGEHSWAVICIEGKINIVKFVDLGRKDAQYVLDFLKQFEAGRHCVDAPYRDMFYNGLFKF